MIDPMTDDVQTPADTLELAPELEMPEVSQKGFWKKLKKGLFMTHTEIIDRMSSAMEGKQTLDEEVLEYMEEILIGADLGIEASLELIDQVRKDLKGHETADVLKVRETLVDHMSLMLLDAPRPRAPQGHRGPRVTLVVGVNGVGKTTSIAKLTQRSLDQGESVLLAAADTFRAAAIEQLELWGQRLGVPVVRSKAGGDPAAVVFDALQAAKARRTDHVIVDTAGRLHTKEHLMAELGKIGRIVEREAVDWERRTLLVLDATTGQNALAQARTFSQVVPVDGVLLAKLDGTAKGGMAVAISRDLRLPILYLGVGETPDDLIEFRPREFATALLG